MSGWQKWYAWRPVKIDNRPETYVWFNWVARRKVNGQWHYVWCYPLPIGDTE